MQARGSRPPAALVTAAIAAAATALSAAAPVAADPGPGESAVQPWPTLRYFDRPDPGAYFPPGVDGLWFTSATGQNCGIWGRGSFACSGDIPGAPAGTRAVGWVTGDRAMHYDWTVPLRMPPTRALAALPPRSVVEHQGTTCAVTDDNGTYCERGPLKFLITPAGTWLTPPWMDLRR
ncbi:hypothetical protein FR943_01680 [Mycobacterium sp. TNTM28]|uniref:Secreted protein n=1 Tax=[Mycobacterium] fortunisiensis TaxID=2600579 RepID=A0ABS6KGA1_9MYCO|nr:hypothetical protein [[Mycobacterium] fortunisiensis]MBU9762563.1 hypothetical protein [[Mycobacterium] fortunisiensis]